ncbi:MAG: acyl-ACP--UDP-N-acetylglucosamine O-acyltransferase [Variibacter sp.]|nr:acyl-ACP--UDP-N-acetylglucosamine O-acyltransferase [Variibacter sp.]
MAAARIHPLAQVDPAARIAEDVEIGPFCVVGPNVSLGPGCRLIAQVHVGGHTTIGARTVVYPQAVLGMPPQSFKYGGGPTRLVIGADCTIREGVTMSTGTEDGGGVTEVGDHGLFMAYSHVAHDCRVGHHVVFANNTTLAGHCEIGDHVFIAGLSALHQFTRVGAGAMIAGMSGIRGDVIPFGLADGRPARLVGVNVIGMKRRGYTAEACAAARKAYFMLFRGSGSLEERVAATEAALGAEPVVAQILAFIRARGKRPLCRAARADATDEE